MTGEHAADVEQHGPAPVLPWWERVLRSSTFRLPARTFLWAFLGIAIPGALGWLNDLTEWARSEGQAPFPDARSLAFLGVAGISAGSIALVNAVAVWLENRAGRGILRHPQ